MHTNQFGYQKKLSCKHAYFVINESIQYFGSLKRKILSGYLFNFYMDNLINQCVNFNLDIGCKRGNQKTSIIAYCDEIFLMTTNKVEMDLMLKKVEKYALDLKFNVNKCFNLTIKPPGFKSKTTTKLYLNNFLLTKR